MYDKPVQRILVPIDFSTCSLAAFEFAHRLAVSLGATIEALYVHGSHAGDPSSHELEAAREEMRRFIRSAPRPGGLLPVSELVEVGDVREVIVSIAENQHFDLIVLGTHGRTGRPRMLAGSIAESVVRTATVPVLTVRGPS